MMSIAQLVKSLNLKPGDVVQLDVIAGGGSVSGNVLWLGSAGAGVRAMVVESARMGVGKTLGAEPIPGPPLPARFPADAPLMLHSFPPGPLPDDKLAQEAQAQLDKLAPTGHPI
jgi:hypothetical protein